MVENLGFWYVLKNSYRSYSFVLYWLNYLDWNTLVFPMECSNYDHCSVLLVQSGVLGVCLGHMHICYWWEIWEEFIHIFWGSLSVAFFFPVFLPHFTAAVIVLGSVFWFFKTVKWKKKKKKDSEIVGFYLSFSHLAWAVWDTSIIFLLRIHILLV